MGNIVFKAFLPLLDKEVLAEALGEEFSQSPPGKRPLNGGTWARNPEMHESMAASQGLESLTATPFRDCNTLTVPQVLGGEGSSPPQVLGGKVLPGKLL